MQDRSGIPTTFTPAEAASVRAPSIQLERCPFASSPISSHTIGERDRSAKAGKASYGRRAPGRGRARLAATVAGFNRFAACARRTANWKQAIPSPQWISCAKWLTCGHMRWGWMFPNTEIARHVLAGFITRTFGIPHSESPITRLKLGPGCQQTRICFQYCSPRTVARRAHVGRARPAMDRDRLRR